MSIKEIKEQLKSHIDDLTATDAKLVSKDLMEYFDYLRDRRAMPANLKLSFAQYLELLQSVEQAKGRKLHPASKVLSQLKKKYVR